MQHFPELQLTFEEARVLGCLLEKEVLTPGSYPMTLNALVTACNQSSSRDPVTHFGAEDVETALRGLSEKYLIEKILGGRAPKHEHCLPHVLSMQDRERAVLTVLLLRGPQSVGEIKQRTERLHHFDSLEEVEETLTWFIEYPHGPLVRRIGVGTGRRVETFAHLLAEHAVAPERPAAADVPAGSPQAEATAVPDSEEVAWRTRMESQLAELRSDLEALREQLGG